MPLTNANAEDTTAVSVLPFDTIISELQTASIVKIRVASQDATFKINTGDEGPLTEATSALTIALWQPDYHHHFTILSTALCILFYSGVSTYVRLYGSGLFNFGSNIDLLTLFAYFLDTDVPTYMFIENVILHLKSLQ